MRGLFFGFWLIALTNVSAQPGIWTWVHGDTLHNQPPIRGTQGVAHPDNSPSGAYEGAEWLDHQGRFWYWEPVCIDCDGVSGRGNDLWMYDPSTNMWTWMKGNAEANSLGSHGVQGVEAVTNLPAARGFGPASWVDTTGNLWLYGGHAPMGGNHTSGDLWKFNIATNNWTWMNGPSIPNTMPTHGTMGVPSATNQPGSRCELIATWVDRNLNELWFFGGAVGPNTLRASDLWKYSIAQNVWTWMKGPNTYSDPGTYGTLGIEDLSNNPRARLAATSWTDTTGMFWLFGGQGISSAEHLNDLWKYDPTTNNWTWVHGASVPQDLGNVNSVCIESELNVPISRFECRARWVDVAGDLWLWGGRNHLLSSPNQHLNDLWRYRISENTWTVMWPDSLYNPYGNFGTKGQASPCNRPYGAAGVHSWYQSETNSFYLLGGQQFNPLAWGSPYSRSVLWKFTLDSACSQYSCPHICDTLQIELELQQPDQENSGQALVTVENGVAPYSYSLDSVNYQPENTFTDLEHGVYQIFITDAFGCTGSTSFLIEEPEVPVDPPVDPPTVTEGVSIEHANDHLVISVDRALRFRLFDAIGRLVLDQGVSEGSVQIFTGRFASGIYIYHFSEIGITGKIFIN